MPNIDPSYIRSIRDGIINGNIEANNQEALPDGLVGLYDRELFPPTMKYRERKETLNFFLVFAIAQKEISADFASAILGDEWFNLHNDDESKEDKRLQKVNDLIQLHSKRFNSAGGGKYRLYHERFRLYILQKVSEEDIAFFNQMFITLCEIALEIKTVKDISEKESYALEFISTHYFNSAMQGESECLNKEQAAALKKHAYDQQYWERQVKANKGFEWSKRMLNQMMSWASKFNEDDEVIECALNKVDLYHQEQNDAPRIVQLVADGDIETALERIEKFGEEDKEGLQRKFILYMLCLMELTLLDSKDKNHAKTSIVKLLKHLDEFIPNSFNWNNLFPSFLMFQMTFIWAELELDFLKLISRNNEWDFEWIKEKEFISNLELEVLIECASIISSPTKKFAGLMMIYIKLVNQNNFDFIDSIQKAVIECAKSVLDIYVKIECLLDISSILNKNAKLNDSTLIIEEAVGLALKMDNELPKIKALSAISIEMANQGLINQASTLIEETINYAYSINEISTKFDALIFISYELDKLGHQSRALLLIDEANRLIFTISSKEKFKSILELVKVWYALKEYQKSTNLFNELLSESIKEENNNVLRGIIVELIRQDQINKALSIVNKLNPFEKESAYIDIIQAMEYPNHLNELLNLKEQLPNHYLVNYEYTNALIKCNLLERASEQIIQIESYIYRAIICKNLINKYLEINDLKRANLYIDELKSIYNNATYILDIPPILKILSESYFSMGDFENAIKLNSEILSNLGLNHSLNDVKSSLQLFCFENNKHEIEYSIILEQIVENYFETNQKIESIEILIDKINKNDSQTRMLVKLRSISKEPRVLEKIKNNLGKLGINRRGGSMKYPIALNMIDQNLFEDALGIELEEYDGYNSKKMISEIIDNKLVEKLCYQEIENDNIDYVLSQIDKITDTQNYINTFLKLFDIINKRKKFEFINLLINKITESKKDNSDVLASLSTFQYNRGNVLESNRLMVDALRASKGINTYMIIKELAKQHKITEAIEMSNGLIIEDYHDSRYRALVSISIELMAQDYFSESIKILKLIDLQSSIQNEWIMIAERMIIKYGLLDSLKKIESIDSKILMEKLKHSILQISNVTKINLAVVSHILKEPEQSIDNIKHFLILFFTNKLFFSNLSPEKLDRYNRTLNLQWAIDIKNKLPN